MSIEIQNSGHEKDRIMKPPLENQASIVQKITALSKTKDSIAGIDVSHLSQAVDDENLTELGDEPVLDSNQNEKEVLKRYHDIYRRFRKLETFPVIEKEYTPEEDITGNGLLDGIIDFSVCYGLQGQTYVDEAQMNLQYVVLQAALVLTITYTYYIEPDLSNENLNHAFSFVMGLSAIFHIAVIVVATVTTGCYNMAYTELDTAVMKVTIDHKQGLTSVINVLNYVALIAAIVGMLLAGFDRSDLDGYLQLYAIAVILALLVFFIKMLGTGATIQNYRAYLFYKKYCQPDGQLKQKYLDTLMQDDEEESAKELMKKLLKAVEKAQ